MVSCKTNSFNFSTHSTFFEVSCFVAFLLRILQCFGVHALVGAEIQPLMRQPISSAQSVMTDVAPRGFSSDSVGRGGPGNSPSLYAAGGAHCNRPLPRDKTRQSHAQWCSREATMAHDSPGRKGREGKKAGEGR